MPALFMKVHYMTKLLAFLIFSASAFGQSKSKDTTTNNEWKTLEAFNYSIQYPPTWVLDESGRGGTSFVVLSPVESDSDIFRENVNLLIQDLSGKNIDLNKYTEISESQIKTMIQNSALLESKRVKGDFGECQVVLYTGDQGAFHFKFKQYFFVVREKAYVLTFTTEQGKFEKFKKTGERILSSFQLHQ